MVQPSGQITVLLNQLGAGDKEAGDRLFPLVYQELKKMAARYMRAERADHTLQPTALVHEAYLKLVDQSIEWHNRKHFFAVAAQVMRRILVDFARQASSEKRGGKRQKITLDAALAYRDDRSNDVIAVDEALMRLEKLDQRQCRVVELRFFAGLSIEETADALELSERTVKREWTLAKAWLYSELAQSSRRDGPNRG
jgi:RNA polymerase sigma factor (TIGR02999 family)